jgi:hypothetical protein
MIVKIHYKGSAGGGMLTLTEDASALPRLPEVGEKIEIGTAHGSSKKSCQVQSITWVVEDINTEPDTIPVYELTMNLHCQS